jgi:hypothetical protein
MKRIPCILAAVALVAVGGAAVAQTTAGTQQADRRALIADGEPPDLFLLQTGDVIGYLDPCG